MIFEVISLLFCTFAVTKNCSKSSQMPILRLAEVAARGGLIFKEGIKKFSEANVPMEKSLSCPGREAFMLKKRGFYL